MQPDFPPLPPSILPPGSWLPEKLKIRLIESGLRPMQARDAVHLWMRGFHLDGLTALAALGQVPGSQAKFLAPLLGPEEPLELAEQAQARDGTLRLLWRTFDGQIIESVVIPADNRQRTTLCLSSQVGCGRRCTFCETGKLGLVRNLQVHEIVGQFRQARLLWQKLRGDLPELTNVVFMGMGEPLDNLDNVMDSVTLLTHSSTYGLSARKISVSTVGVAQKFPAFFAGCKANLALSLNAPDDARRTQVMPINQRVAMADLKRALLDALPPGRDVMVEYILFADFNDAPEDAVLLRQWLDGIPARLNLIPANPGPDPRLRSPSQEAVLRFQKSLLDNGIRTMVRYPHGREVGGACGQLAGQHRQREGMVHA